MPAIVPHEGGQCSFSSGNGRESSMCAVKELEDHLSAASSQNDSEAEVAWVRLLRPAQEFHLQLDLTQLVPASSQRWTTRPTR
jgi:hypothetical protein